MIEWVNELLGLSTSTDLSMALAGLTVSLLLVKTLDILCVGFGRLTNTKH